MKKTTNTQQKMKPFTYKKNYLNKVEKVSRGIYNYKTYLNGKVIFEEKNIKKPNMFKIGEHIKNKIDKYNVKKKPEKSTIKKSTKLLTKAEIKEDIRMLEVMQIAAVPKEQKKLQRQIERRKQMLKTKPKSL